MTKSKAKRRLNTNEKMKTCGALIAFSILRL
jgi:hypothetical protein